MLAPPAIGPDLPLAAYTVLLARHQADKSNARKRRRRSEMSPEEREALRAEKKQKDAARYDRDREKIIARAKGYYRKNRVEILKKSKRPERQARTAMRTLLYGAAKRAAERGLEFNLDFSDVQIPEVCPVLGIPIEYGANVKGGTSTRPGNPSLDRFDNSKGYVKGNVRVISLRANRLKSNATLADVEALLAYMRCER